MIREKVEVKDFRDIAKTYKHYIWHFLQKNQSESNLGLFSYFDEKNHYSLENPLKNIIDNLELPYFESYVEESYDFLIDNRIDGKIIFNPHFDSRISFPRERFYTPMILGFEHFTNVKSTTEICYCVEGFMEVLASLNPIYVQNLAEKLL